MAAQGVADKVFVALPETYEDGLSVLSWVLSYFPQDKTEIIITHVITSAFDGSDERESMTALILSQYLSYCATYEFQADALVCVAENIAEGIVQVIAQNEPKNLVMISAGDSDMTNLASETATKVMRDANLSCKLWFVSDGNLIFTREVNSSNLTPAPTSEERNNRNEESREALSGASSSSNSGSPIDEEYIDVDTSLSLIAMLDEASEADTFEEMREELLKKMTHLITKQTKKLQRNEQEIRELKEILQRENQEKNQLRRQIEENEHVLSEAIEQFKAENDLLRRQLASERRLALEKQVSYFQLVIKDLEIISAPDGDHIDSLQVDLHNLQQERDNLLRKVKELCIQRESMHSSSSTALSSEFSLQELEQATQNFSESLKIGEGGFGPVYKGSLRGTTVAIKLFNSQNLQGISEFHQEITILTKVRHPNLVTLMGACSEVSALVYEYLSNGSLEDRLICANNTPPLTWQARTRIIGEICLALIFLHSNKPQLVVHGDLKPGNILLDTNLVSKLGDFGISRLLKQPDTNATAFFQTSHPAGTFSYVDPEYLRTGILTPKSDIYSLGIIILRLLTGKSPLNIIKQVEDAVRDGILLSVIDESAGKWPLEQAEKLAKIALRCAEIYRSNRPDLVHEVWAVVEPLMKDASTYVESQGHESEHGEQSIPSHFLCPILQEVMQNPYIAADGFTYEEEAIRQWLRSHNTSPMTNLALPNTSLIPNHVLRSGIQEWLQQHPQS